MEIKDIRRKNILFLADSKYTRGALAEKLGYADTNYLNQLCKGFANIGNNTARKIELKLNLENGWMDKRHDIDENKEQEFARLYGALPEDSQEKVLEIMRGYSLLNQSVSKK